MNFVATKTGSASAEHQGDVLKPAQKNGRQPAGVLELRARPFDQPADHSEFAGNLLSRDDQERLLRNATLVEFRRGGMSVYSEGEPSDFVYFISEGIIRTSRCAENGHRQILSFRVPGDIFGFPEGGRYVNSAETVCPGRIYRVPWQRLQQMMLADPQLQLILLEKLCYDFRQAQARIMILGQQNIYQRLASFILDLSRRPEFYDEKRARLRLPVNRFDLADYLGTAPESAARAFARLESDGLVRRVSTRMVEILNFEGLQGLQRERRRSRSAAHTEAHP